MGVSPVLDQAVSGRLFHYASPFLCSMTLWEWEFNRNEWGLNGGRRPPFPTRVTAPCYTNRFNTGGPASFGINRIHKFKIVDHSVVMVEAG